MPSTGVIFDVDGTLADTNYLHVVSWARAFRDGGENVPNSAIHALIGMGSDHLVSELIGRDDEDIADGHTRHYEKLMAEIRPLPGAADILAEVHRRGATVALASSASEDQLDAMLEAIDAEDGVIDHMVTADDVDGSKPDPDVFKAALEATGLDPSNTIVVGDTVWDVKAAEPLGLKVVGVTTGGISGCELREAGAIAVYDDVAHLLRELDRSPLARLLQAPTSTSTSSRS